MQIPVLLASISASRIWVGVLMLVLAYFSGSIPFGYLAGRLKGVDLREHGSGNIGATNAIRVLGKGLGIPVFILDFLKGYIPVALGWHVFNEYSPDLSATFLVLMAMSAVLGHTYTCWLSFKGGKGVATGAGVLAALVPWPAMVVIGLWAVVFLVSRYVSLASIVAAAVFPVTVLYTFNYFSDAPVPEGSLPVVIFSFIIALLVILKHRDNIRRLLAGEEHRAFSGKKS